MCIRDSIRSYGYVAFDTETTGLDEMTAELVGVSLCVKPGNACYVPIGHKEGDPTDGLFGSSKLCADQIPIDLVIGLLRPILDDPSILIIGQNIKFDRNILARYGIKINSIKNDTMMMSYVLDASATRHNLDALSSYYLNHKTSTFEEVAGKGVKQVTFDKVPLDLATNYAAEDADITLRLYEVLEPKLNSIKSLKKLMEDIEIPLIEVLSDMEQNGTLLNSKILASQSKDLESRIKKLEKLAYEIAGEEFNLGSTKQLREIFFDKLNYRVIKKTPGGQPSTDEKVLQELSEEYELPKVLLEHRTLSKLKSTYTDKLPGQISSNTGKVHTSFHQAVTTTGRLSSSDPNLQNIPIRTEQGAQIRSAFIAEKGNVILAADYSQIELRIMAHISGDQNLIEAFNNNQDVHSSTASQVFGTEISMVTKDQRRKAKAINFGLIYGMSAFGLAKQIDVSRTEAKQYIDGYFENYPGVLRFMEETKEKAKSQGYVETVLGRRLYLPQVNSKNKMLQQHALRTAINAPMQGSSADIIKKAMLDIQAWIDKENHQIKMFMQVHDELVFELDEKMADSYATDIKELMSNALKLSIPLDVDVGIGSNWQEAH